MSAALPPSEETILAWIQANPAHQGIPQGLERISIEDAWVASGSLFQTVWNARDGRPLETGIRDVDLIYFDPDLSLEAELRVREAVAKIPRSVGVPLQIRNQARVHLWFPEKFGIEYPALQNSLESLERYMCSFTQIAWGVGAKNRDRLVLPEPLSDLWEGRIRRTDWGHRQPQALAAKVSRWRSRWELQDLEGEP